MNTSKILNGKILADSIKLDAAKKIQELHSKSKITPCLAVILVGDDAASKIYVNNKKNACTEVGIKSIAHELPTTTSTKEIIGLLQKLNKDPNVHGILVQLPLPSQIDSNIVINNINPKKDVDGFTPENLGLLALNTPYLRPCTPFGIIQMLKANNVNLHGINACVIGTSNIVGRPMVLELLAAQATVTVCNSATKNLQQLISMAELLIVATGVPHLVKAQWIKQDAIVIDVGINRLPNGKLIGDVEFEKALPKVKLITPVPGGVGPMTIATLLQNTLIAAQNLIKAP